MALTFKPIKGSARHYRGSNGKEYTRRQRDDILAQRAGFRNRYELEKTRIRIRDTQPDWLKRVRQHTGRTPSWEDYHNASEVDRLRRELAAKNGRAPSKPWEFDSESPELIAPDGPLANYLDAAGIRKKNDRPVGGS